MNGYMAQRSMSRKPSKETNWGLKVTFKVTTLTIMQTPLRKARCDQNKTQAEIASAIGLTEASLSRIERGQQAPSAAIAAKLAILLGISELEILYPERFKTRGRSGKAA
jgi:DNA-binding XRE family transcriptional regulator